MIHVPLMSEISHWISATPPKRAVVVPDQTSPWRSDIDGLRGLAVLSLLAVHMVPQWGHGSGLVGLDMFFVISGFLITSRLMSAHAGGHINLPAFYARRIQRIVPSLCLVLLFCVAFSWLFTSPEAAHQFGKHIVSATLFASNFMFWRDAVTPGFGSDGTPLFHLWALAFLVQFCFVWPMVMAWLLRSGRSVVGWVGALMICSLALNFTLIQSNPDTSFLLLPSRAWELMVGALLACLTAKGGAGPVAWIQSRLVRSPLAQQHASNVVAWSGVGLLGASLWLITSSVNLPGWWALLPTLGTFALLASGPEAAVNRCLLSHPILRFYGGISYPLYLWHWPLLSFPVVMGVPLTQELRITILIASVVLAALTCELVEKPARSVGPARYVPFALIGALVATGALGWLLMHPDWLAWADIARVQHE